MEPTRLACVKLSAFFTTEEVADNTGSNQQIEILDQMNSVEANAMQEQRKC